MEKKIEFGDFSVTYNETQEIKDAVFERVVNFLKEVQSFSGECIAQNDDAIINSHYIFCEIADEIIKFNFEWKD